MGVSTKKTKTKSSQTIAPTDAYAPNINDAASTFRPAFDKQSAIADSFAPGLQRAGGLFNRTIDGDFLDGNPHLQGVIDSSNRDITDRVNSNFMSRFGSGYHTNALVRGLGENEQRLRYGDYAQERAYQNEAPGNLAGVAAAGTALPGIAAGQYGSNVGGLLGRYVKSDGKSSSKTSGGFLGDLLLAMAANAGKAGSMGGG